MTNRSKKDYRQQSIPFRTSNYPAFSSRQPTFAPLSPNPEMVARVTPTAVVGARPGADASAPAPCLRQTARLVPVEDGLRDVRGEIAEANEPREIGPAHQLARQKP